MKDAPRIVEHLLERLGHVYRRPLMYAGTADCLDLLIDELHDLLAWIHGDEERFRGIVRDFRLESGCGALGLAGHYRLDLHPERDPGEHEVATYVVNQWRTIDGRLGIEVPEPPRSAPSPVLDRSGD